jgi:hypothetical protein
MKKWLLIGFMLIAVLMVALTAIYRALLSKDFLISKIEASINSRVQIGELGVSLFSIPARVVIANVIVAERDDVVRHGLPHDQRSRLESGEFRIKEVSFDVSLKELFSKEIKVSQLNVVGAHADLVMNETGELNIEKLFAAPPGTSEKNDKKGLNAKDSPGFVAALDRLILKDASFDMVIKKTGLEMIGRDVNLDLSDIKVNPNALELVNEAHMQLDAHFEAFSSKKGRLKYGQIGLKGPARVRLFDPATGALAPDAEIDFMIDPSSYVSTKAPYVVKLYEVTEQLAKLGLQSKPLPEKLTFGRERKLKASHAQNKIDLHEPVSMVMDDWELVFEGGSWVELGSEEHRSGVRLIASAKVSDFVRKHLIKVTEIVPEKSRSTLEDELIAQWFVENRLNLKASTHGALSDPGVKLATPLPDAEKIAKDYAKSKLLDFINEKLLK